MASSSSKAYEAATDTRKGSSVDADEHVPYRMLDKDGRKERREKRKKYEWDHDSSDDDDGSGGGEICNKIWKIWTSYKKIVKTYKKVKESETEFSRI